MIIDGKPCLVACNIERNHAAPFEALDKSRSQRLCSWLKCLRVHRISRTSIPVFLMQSSVVRSTAATTASGVSPSSICNNGAIKKAGDRDSS